MIDTDKYEGHYKASWANQYGDVVKLVYPNESSPSLDADQRLIIDAPLLLAEVKSLRRMADELIAIWEILEEDYPHVDRAIVKELVERKIGDYYLHECNLR